MSRLVLSVIVVLIASLLPSRSFASGFAIGKICLEGVKANIVPDETTKDAKGEWAEATYSVDGAVQQQVSAHFVLFRKPMQSYKEFPTCASITKLEAARQNEPVLSGTIDDLHIKGHLFTATTGSNRIQIDEKEFNATLTKVTSRPRPAHGGTVDFRAPSSLTLVNTKRILTDNVSGDGTIEISTSLTHDVPGTGITEVNTSGIAIVNAHFALLGGSSTTATVAPASPTDQEIFAIDIADGQASLVEGTLSGIPSSHLKGVALEFGAGSLANPDLTAKHIEIAATRATAEVTLTGLSGQSTQLLAGGKSLKYDMTSPKLVAESIKGEGARKREAVVIGAPAIGLMKATAETAQTVTGTGSAIFTGAAVIDITNASKNAINATSIWTKPNVTAAEFFLPSSTVKTVHWNLSGSPDGLSVSGDIDSTVQRLQTLTMTDRLPIQLTRSKVTNEIRIPIKTNANSISGTFAVADRDQSGTVTAGLSRFHLDGVLIIDLEDIKNTRTEFPIDGVQVGLKAMIATQPFIAGTKPAFAAVGVTGRNRTPLVVGVTRSGLFDIAVDTVTLGEPVIRIGQDGSEARASLMLNSTGSVLITSDISNGTLLLTRGSFEAKGADGANGIEFHLLDSGKWVDLGGTRVVDPVLTVKTLSLHIDRTQAVEVGVGDIVGISANASSITKPVDSARPTDISYTGKLAEPFTIDEFAAAHVKIEDVLVIDGATVSNVKLHITNADVRFGGDAHITNGDFTFTAVSLAELKINEVTIHMLQQAHVSVSGNIDPGSGLGVNSAPSFSVDIGVSGQSDKLSGDGSAHIGGFSGFAETSFDTGFRCYPDGVNPGDTFKPPMELNFALSATDLKAHLRGGRFTAEGQTGPLALLAHTKGHSDCNGKNEHYILVPDHYAWTYGVCTKGFPIVEFYTCKWEVHIPEVSFNWHPHAQSEFGATSLGMTAPVVRLGDGNLHLCNIGAIVVPATVVVMGVTPYIDTPYQGASDLINNLMGPIFVAAESTAATALANGTGWTISAAGTGLGNLMCIK
jgi:hypothetical protein